MDRQPMLLFAGATARDAEHVGRDGRLQPWPAGLGAGLRRRCSGRTDLRRRRLGEEEDKRSSTGDDDEAVT